MFIRLDGNFIAFCDSEVLCRMCIDILTAPIIQKVYCQKQQPMSAKSSRVMFRKQLAWHLSQEGAMYFFRQLLGERSEPHTGVFNRDFALFIP